MTADEARQITDAIKSATEYLWQLLLDAYNGRAWEALGYESWRAWASAEFNVSERQSYYLLDRAEVLNALQAEVGAEPLQNLQIAGYEASRLKPHLGEAVEDVRELVTEGMEPRQAVETVVEKYTSPLAPLMSSATPEWYTPPEIIEATVKVLGAIDLDPCADADKQIPAATHYTQDDDGMAQEWRGRVYMNPPYGSEIVRWVQRLCEQYAAGAVPEAIALVPARTDTQWWDEVSGAPVCFIRGRLKFSGHENSAPFPSAVVYLGANRKKFAKVFGALGHIYEPCSIASWWKGARGKRRCTACLRAISRLHLPTLARIAREWICGSSGRVFASVCR
jgi:phage N-6-adenine-methyltransferase